MAKVWKSVGREILLYWIQSIEDEASDRLSAWEVNFIDSLSQQLQYKTELSQAQEEKLESIYAKYTK